MNNNIHPNSRPIYKLKQVDISRGVGNIDDTDSYSKVLIGIYVVLDELSYDSTSHDSTSQSRFNSENLIKTMRGVNSADTELIDRELNELEIVASPEIHIKIERIAKLSPSILIQIMTSSVVKAAAYIIIFAGLIALTTALITLIPVIAAALALIHVTTIVLAFDGSILFTIGAAFYLSSSYCQKIDSDKDVEVDVTMEQLLVPESRKRSFSPEVRQVFLDGFFSVKEMDESLDEEGGSKPFILS